MATAIAPRSDISLSVLAGRAVPALARLSGNPSAWDERIEDGLRSGIMYCRALRARGGRILRASSSDEWSPLKRSVEGNSDATGLIDIRAASEDVERFLNRIASREHTPEIRELVAAIDFLRKAATDR